MAMVNEYTGCPNKFQNKRVELGSLFKKIRQIEGRF